MSSANVYINSARYRRNDMALQRQIDTSPCLHTMALNIDYEAVPGTEQLIDSMTNLLPSPRSV